MPSTALPRWLMSLAALCAGVMLCTSASAQRKLPPPSKEAVQYSFAPIVRQTAPAVVNVYVRSRVQSFSSPFADDPFFRRFFGDRFGQPTERLQNSLGSGVIVSPSGIVVTNTHVIKGGGQTEIKVVLADKREFDAKVILQDEKTDIAVLRIEGGDGRFPTLALEDSRQSRGRRPGAGDRQSVRRRPDGDAWYSVGSRPL